MPSVLSNPADRLTWPFFGFNVLMLSWLSVDFISGALPFDVLLSLRVGDVMRDIESVTQTKPLDFPFHNPVLHTGFSLGLLFLLLPPPAR